jgi:CubicO group peptidase (beta-lactamase class C family)
VACDGIVRAGLGERYTGAVLRVERAGAAVFERAYGRLAAAPDDGDVEITTRFDLASLTKVFVSTLALIAVDERRLALDEPLVAFPIGAAPLTSRSPCACCSRTSPACSRAPTIAC